MVNNLPEMRNHLTLLHYGFRRNEIERARVQTCMFSNEKWNDFLTFMFQFYVVLLILYGCYLIACVISSNIQIGKMYSSKCDDNKLKSCAHNNRHTFPCRYSLGINMRHIVENINILCSFFTSLLQPLLLDSCFFHYRVTWF